MKEYLAIGNNELGNTLQENSVCPNCGELHILIQSKPEPLLQAVKCEKDNELYLVGIFNKEILK